MNCDIIVGMVSVLKFLTPLSFCSQALLIGAGIHKMLVRIAKWEAADQN